MRISDWSSDVCSSDLSRGAGACLIDGTEDWKSPISIERRFSGEYLVRLKPFCVHPIDLNGVHHAAKAFTLMAVMNEHHLSTLRQHDVVVDRKSTRLNSSH